MPGFSVRCLVICFVGGYSTTPSPSLFFLSASPCLKGLGLALGKNKEGEGVMEDGGRDWGAGVLHD